MIQKKIIKYFLIAIIGIPLFISCIPQKRLVLLQKKDSKDSTFFPVKQYIHKLEVGDNIYITVTGLDEKTAAIFNSQAKNYSTFTAQSNVAMYNQNITQTPGMYLWSYTINDSGFINFPLIDKIFLKDLTLREAQKVIQDSINQYANYITAVVKYLSFQINVLGEVKKPGSLYINSEYVNIFDAIGLAGDFGDYANRNKIRIIRKTSKGNEIASLDLTDEKILSSDYYYLQPGDIIYVSPMTAKTFGLRNVQISSFITFGASILLLYNTLKN